MPLPRHPKPDPPTPRCGRACHARSDNEFERGLQEAAAEGVEIRDKEHLHYWREFRSGAWSVCVGGAVLPLPLPNGALVVWLWRFLSSPPPFAPASAAAGASSLVVWCLASQGMAVTPAPPVATSSAPRTRPSV